MKRISIFFVAILLLVGCGGKVPNIISPSMGMNYTTQNLPQYIQIQLDEDDEDVEIRFKVINPSTTGGSAQQQPITCVGGDQYSAACYRQGYNVNVTGKIVIIIEAWKGDEMNYSYFTIGNSYGQP